MTFLNILKKEKKTLGQFLNFFRSTTAIGITQNSDFFIFSEFEVEFLPSVLHIGTVIFILTSFSIALNKNSVMLYMIGLEMLMLSCGFNFVIFSLYLNCFEGLILALVILGVAASETAIGLGIIIACYSRNYSLNMLEFERSGGL